MFTTITIYGVRSFPEKTKANVERVIGWIEGIDNKVKCSIVDDSSFDCPKFILVRVGLCAGKFNAKEVTETIVSRLNALLQNPGTTIQIEVTLLHPDVSVFTTLPAPTKPAGVPA